jgi:hypothetical protein
MPPHARAGGVGRAHRFAADPQCSVDAGRSTPPRVSSAGTARGRVSTPGRVHRLQSHEAAGRQQAAQGAQFGPRLGLAGHGGQGSLG